MKEYIKSKELILENEILEGGVLEIENGKISNILDEVPGGEIFVDYSKYTVAPGFVDTHIHGIAGADIMDATPESLFKITREIVKTGVTTYFPTTLTASFEDTCRAIENISVNYKFAEGAKIGGIFLEGPFFAKKFKGAQNEKYFVKPEIEWLKKWKELAGELPIKIAVAPEIEGATEFIQEATKLGVIVALGHSDANYEQAKKAVESGAKIFVHTYNAMSPLHHRNPGMVGAALTLKDVFAELICDGHHVHPVAAKIVVDMRKPDSTALVTDCMSAGAMPEGSYKLGEFDVNVKNGTARLSDGNLAGSILLLKDAVKNVVDWELADKFNALRMASLVPAKSVGIENLCGKISVGKFADFVVLDDELNLIKVYINGKKVYTG